MRLSTHLGELNELNEHLNHCCSNISLVQTQPPMQASRKKEAWYYLQVSNKLALKFEASTNH